MPRMDMRRHPQGFAGLPWPRQPLRELGPEFYSELAPQGLPQPELRLYSEEAARLLGLRPPADPQQRAEWAELFSGNRVDPEQLPLATVYAGHQFGNWAGQLGDGRAHLLGELAAPDAAQNGGHACWEVQLKGAGRTPYSRFGDGRAVLRSSLREFLASEAMWHLGVPTTRALCLVDSPLPVRRERLERAAVVTRLAPSFVRIGHFEHFSHSGQHAALRRLLDAWIARFEPDCAHAADPALALLQRVAQRSAELVAHWLAVGFVHGVLNTDNLSMLGWTLDYGPFGFLDAFDPDYTPNTSDTSGRYSWGRQPAAVHWGLYALAAALKPLIGDAQAIEDALQAFPAAFDAAWRARLRAKLGLGAQSATADALARDWLALLQRARRLDPQFPLPARRGRRYAAGATGRAVRRRDRLRRGSAGVAAALACALKRRGTRRDADGEPASCVAPPPGAAGDRRSRTRRLRPGAGAARCAARALPGERGARGIRAAAAARRAAGLPVVLELIPHGARMRRHLRRRQA